MHISLDNASEDGEGVDDDSEKGYLGDASLIIMEHEEPMVERLREVVEMLRPEQQELYRRIVVNGESPEDIAKELGVGRTAILNRMTRIKENIKKNF